MKFIRRWLLRAINKARNESCEAKCESNQSYNMASSKDDSANRLNFNVLVATGGVVVTINTYDRQTNRNNEAVHIMHDDEEIATNIGHLISMELLRR